MGAVMRGEQTLRLIQLYHTHYPDIARNTQDSDGRKLRTHLWQSITDDLNNSYETNFSVEQYKKKIQNVQCTSRQKANAGKRLGAAELEYLKLFERDLLDPLMDSERSRSSSTPSRESNTATNVEQLLEGFGLRLDPSSSNGGNEEITEEATVSSIDNGMDISRNFNAAEQLILALGQLSQHAVNSVSSVTPDEQKDIKPNGTANDIPVTATPKSPGFSRPRKRRSNDKPLNELNVARRRVDDNEMSDKYSNQMNEILDNQRRMLGLLERQMERTSPNATPSPPTFHPAAVGNPQNSLAEPLKCLFTQVQQLCDVLGNLDKTLQERLPLQI
jgi:hypothetical protein